jgi:hypothetical protein
VDRWLFELDVWIMQDGNYGDFQRGGIVDFAIELVPGEGAAAADGDQTSASLRPVAWRDEEPPAPPPHRDSAAYSLEPAVVYDLVSRVVARTDGVSVLDCGIHVYCTAEPAMSVEVGSTIAVTGTLGVDPFTYFEQLASDDRLPPLIYRWRIERIGRQLAPWREVEAGSFVRHDAELAYASVQATNAWEDDGGHASYALDCVRLDEPPRRTRSRY